MRRTCMEKTIESECVATAAGFRSRINSQNCLEIRIHPSMTIHGFFRRRRQQCEEFESRKASKQTPRAVNGNAAACTDSLGVRSHALSHSPIVLFEPHGSRYSSAESVPVRNFYQRTSGDLTSPVLAHLHSNLPLFQGRIMPNKPISKDGKHHLQLPLYISIRLNRSVLLL